MNTSRFSSSMSAATPFVGGASSSAGSIAIIGDREDKASRAKVERSIDATAELVAGHGSQVTYPSLQPCDVGADAADLIRTAVSQGAKGIAAPDRVPSAEDEAYGAAAQAGATIVVRNSCGDAKAKELGAPNHVGTGDHTTGLAACGYVGAHGATNVTCVNTVPGARKLEDRCRGGADGIARHGGRSKQLPLPTCGFGDPTAVAEAVRTNLPRDPSIDDVMTQGDQDAGATAQVGGNRKVKLGSFNLDAVGLDRVQDGSQIFIVDQQGHTQGFPSVPVLDARTIHPTWSPTQPILIGRVVVGASNMQAMQAGVEAGVR